MASEDQAEGEEGQTGLKRVSSGVRGFDAVLGGGLVEGASYIIHGSPGAGKTILANQIAFHIAKGGGRVLYVTLLSENLSKLFAFLGTMTFFDLGRVPADIYYSSVYGTADSDGPDGLVRLITAECQRHRPALLIIDGLFALSGDGAGGSGRRDHRRFVGELSTLTAQMRTTLLLLTNSERPSSSPEYTMADGWIEMNDQLAGERMRRFFVVHKHRGSDLLPGRHDYRISSDGISIFPRLQSLPLQTSDLCGDGYLGTGLDSLDKIMGGGYPERSTSMLIGPAGSGKTAIGLHFLAGASRQERGLFLGFHETPGQVRRKAKSMGLDFEALHRNDALDIIWYPPLEAIADDIGYQILEAVRERKAKRVVIDGLDALRLAMTRQEEFYTFTRALIHMLKTEGATVLLIREVPQLFFPETLAADQLSGAADTILLCHYTRDHDTVERRLTVLRICDAVHAPQSRGFKIGKTGVELSSEAAPSGKGR